MNGLAELIPEPIVLITRLIFAIAGIIVVGIAITIVYVCWLSGDYFSVMIAELNYEPPESDRVDRSVLGRTFGLSSRSDQSIALPNYFFGPIEVDIRRIVKSSFERGADHYRSGAKRVSDILPSEGLGGFVLGVGIAVGLALGTAIGAVITAGIAIMHVVLAGISAVVAIVACTVLRGADTMLRLVRGVAIRCPNSECSRPIRPYPAYRCPHCGELHRDIRPGPFGVVLRVCRCGRRLPTLLLVGSGRLSAICQICGTELPAGIGKAAEIVIPFLGSVNAGKTQLIYTLSLAIRRLAEDSRAVAVLDGRSTGRLDQIHEVLTSTGYTRPTVSASPEPYIMRLRFGFNERLVYLFDAAGELYYRLPTLENLGYLDKGRTLVFVADPLAADSIWSRLPESDRSKLIGGRSSAIDTQISYEQTREQMRRMGRRVKHIRLAFVVSKADLLEIALQRDYSSSADVRHLVVDPDGMDMGNQVREAEQSFKSVEFIATAALTDENDAADESVVKLATWILASEGIIMKGALG